uniref:TNF superfamily member 15 n=2 Tax=Latimeria chalumnae TaxID=7897 RepID=H3A0K6_LATCH
KRPKAHLTAKPTPPQSGPGKPSLQWEDHLGIAFTEDGMKYEDGSLVIPRNGDYFVYAQVTFRASLREENKGKQQIQHVSQCVTRMARGYPEPSEILSGSKSFNETGNWYETIYLGAAFQLREGDKLFVNVTDLALVDFYKDHKTFFGAFAL